MLRVGSLVLLLALTVVSVALTYFVKKKVYTHMHMCTHTNTDTHEDMTPALFCFPQKPQYQPQLQIIQMVGPNDNDYIYINFKDFEYNQKWEFPRENLELGMHAINTRHTPAFFICYCS